MEQMSEGIGLSTSIANRSNPKSSSPSVNITPTNAASSAITTAMTTTTTNVRTHCNRLNLFVSKRNPSGSDLLFSVRLSRSKSAPSSVAGAPINLPLRK